MKLTPENFPFKTRFLYRIYDWDFIFEGIILEWSDSRKC
jgi:hypothetical protein